MEMGNHQELMEKGGLYSQLYKMQFREPEIEAESALVKTPLERSTRLKTRGESRFVEHQSFQAVKEKMEEFQKLLKENQSEGHELPEIMELRKKMEEAFRKQEAANVLKILDEAINSLKKISNKIQ